MPRKAADTGPTDWVTMLLMSRVNIMVKRPNADSCSGMINEEIMVTHRSVSQQSAPPELPLVGASELLHEVDGFRVEATRRLDSARRIELGQFLTPTPIAKFMASLCEAKKKSVRILDAGAGVGTLTAAVISEICSRVHQPLRISVTAYELDRQLVEYLRRTMDLCGQVCAGVGIAFDSDVKHADFIQSAACSIRAPLFEDAGRFDLGILNPPYRKITSDSGIRHVLRSAGIETSNLYTGFLSLVTRMLRSDGELIAITPRSFCNGPYFRPFREDFLSRMIFKRIHVFESRNTVFSDDDVLQENVIFRAVRGPRSSKTVALSISAGLNDQPIAVRRVQLGELVHVGDSELFIHIVPDQMNQKVAERMAGLNSTISDLGLNVSTGRVVDFRAKGFLRSYPQEDCAPLIHPCHFKDGVIAWPSLNGRKPNAIAISPETRDTLIGKGAYVLTRRFSAKEEPRQHSCGALRSQYCF